MVFPAERRGAAFGVWGAVAGLATAAGPTLGGLLAICYGLVEGQRYNWGTISSFISIPLFIGVGVALLVAFFVVQRRRQDRAPFVSGFRQAAATGLLTGGSGTSAAARGLPAALAAQLQRLGAEVFSQGYVLAMRWTMVMPIAVVVLAAASCLAIRNRPAPAGPAGADAGSGQMAGTISSPGSLGSSGQSPGSSSGTVP